MNVPAKFEVSGFTRSLDNNDWSFVVGLRTPNLREQETVRGRGWHYSNERRGVPEILSLLCSSTPLFPLPTSILVSQKFSHVPLGLGGWPLGHEERRFTRRWAKCPCN